MCSLIFMLTYNCNLQICYAKYINVDRDYVRDGFVSIIDQEQIVNRVKKRSF